MIIFKEDEKNKTNSNNRRKKIIFSFIVLIISYISYLAPSLQAQKLKTLLESGDNAFADNDFFGAAIYYNQAILQDSADIAIQYKYAEASRLNYDYDVADRWYSKVFKKDAEGKLYPECAFWLASIKKSKGKYKEARKLFDKYAKKNKKKKKDYFVLKAQQEVAACDYASLLVSSPDKSINIIHLDSLVNSKVSEYAPIMVDSVLYFSSLRNGTDRDKKNNVNYNKIYTAVQDSIRWHKSKELDTLFNREGVHNANTAFNADYTRVYITRCEQKNFLDFMCEIYFSDFKNGHWQSLQKLPPEINEAGYTNTASINQFIGNYAGYSNTTGTNNCFIGPLAGYSNTTGSSNCYMGDQTGYSNTSGSYNVFSGYLCGGKNTSGTDNCFYGALSGAYTVTGSQNVFVGYGAGVFTDIGSNKTCRSNH